jgi:hypothetical protein
MESALVERIADLYRRRTVDGDRLVSALRDSIVLVPTTGPAGVLSITAHGVTWIPAFTSEAELARFAVARDAGGVAWSYLSVHGWRLLAVLGPDMGLAVDLAGARPMFFPPNDSN